MRSPQDTLSDLEAPRRDFGVNLTGSVITVATNLLDIEKEALVATAKAGELETLQIIHAEQKPEEQGELTRIFWWPILEVPGVMLRLTYLWVGRRLFLPRLRIMDLAGSSLMRYLWMTF